MVLLVTTFCKSDKVERLYQAEGLPKNISIEEFLGKPSDKVDYCTKHGVDYPTFDTWYINEDGGEDNGRSIRFYGKRPADINDTLSC